MNFILLAQAAGETTSEITNTDAQSASDALEKWIKVAERYGLQVRW